jgi:hypothetical protein
MSAVQLQNNEGFFVIFGDCGLPLDSLQPHFQASSARTMVEAFQSIIKKGKGIIGLRIDDRENLSEFARIFQIAIRQMNLAQIKIIIFTTKKEIFNSRHLSQYSFVRVLPPLHHASDSLSLLSTSPPPPQEAKGIIVITGTKSWQNQSMPLHQDAGVSQAEWLPVPGPDQGQNVPWLNYETTEKKELIVNDCVGPQVPTFIYNGDLTWRVRGYFKEYDEKLNKITYHPSHKNGVERLNAELEKTNYSFLASTSTPQARVCSSLVFVAKKGPDFIFRLPEVVRGLQRRANQRAKVTPDKPAVLQFFDEGLGADRTLDVLDVSVGGLGLRVDKDLIGEFSVGRKMLNLNLILLGKVIRLPEAEVRHCSRSDINPDFKVLGLLVNGLTQTDMSFIEMFIFLNG